MAPRGKVIDAAWRSYAEQVIPMAAPEIQRTECRRAFYAGAQALLGGILASLDPGSEPTDGDLERMTEIHAELQQFARDLLEGRA